MNANQQRRLGLAHRNAWKKKSNDWKIHSRILAEKSYGQRLWPKISQKTVDIILAISNYFVCELDCEFWHRVIFLIPSQNSQSNSTTTRIRPDQGQIYTNSSHVKFVNTNMAVVVTVVESQMSSHTLYIHMEGSQALPLTDPVPSTTAAPNL